MATLIKAYGNDPVVLETGADDFLLIGKIEEYRWIAAVFFCPLSLEGEWFPYVSAADILSNRIKPGIFKEKIVFVGVNATGMGDWHLSPLDKMAHGTEVHANIVNSILTGDFIKQPSWARVQNLC